MKVLKMLVIIALLILTTQTFTQNNTHGLIKLSCVKLAAKWEVYTLIFLLKRESLMELDLCSQKSLISAYDVFLDTPILDKMNEFFI
jgi:hypothetical protein